MSVVLPPPGPLMREYLRPWKLVTLIIGITLLVWGSFWMTAPDWDVPISFIMAILTYLTAPWSLRQLVTRQWMWVPLALFWTWFTVDGCYWLYWSYNDPWALAMMRGANFGASLCLYIMCGLLWYFQGSLYEACRAAVRLWTRYRSRLPKKQTP